MPKLSDDEKVVARHFLEQATAALEAESAADPCTYQPPPFLAIFRHRCAKRRNTSTAMQLKEVYVLYDPEVHGMPLAPFEFTANHPAAEWDEFCVSLTGRFGFIYREGKCKGCGQTARSEEGQLVDALDRPPTTGRHLTGAQQ